MSARTASQATDDQHGNPVSGPSEAVELYDRAVDSLLRYRPAVIEHTTALAERHPEVAAGHALTAYLYLTSTEAPDAEVARTAWQAMAAAPMNPRERAHHDAIGAWVGGDWQGAARRLDGLLETWPTDLLALSLGHALDFFCGDAANLRDRPARSLLELDPEHPHTGFVRGMHAFGLEESGQHARAEDVGLAALAANRDDVWAIHAVVHTFEMRGQVASGVAFLDSRRDDWGSDNLFTVHNWWHLALFHLETGAHHEALAIYDREIHHEGSDGVALQLLDASALLWRLFLDGHDTGDRFETLADAWAGCVGATPWYVFNDFHAVLALVGAGRVADAEQVCERLAGYLRWGGGRGTNGAMTAEIGLPACRAIVRFAQGRHDEVVEGLAPVRHVLHHFGGSHAQRDVLQRTLLESALRSGRTDLARALTSERLAARDTSVYGWAQRARVLRALGRDAEADVADRTAASHQAGLSARVPQLAGV